MEKFDNTPLKGSYSVCPLAPVHLVGLACLQLAAQLAFIDIRLSVIPPAVFIALCLAAPFIQRLRFFLPIIRRGDRKKPTIALTFDDGPDPATTPLLLDLLARHSLKATFFVIGEKTSAHPELIRDLLHRGHEVGNHSYRHDVFLMLRRPAVLVDEIVRCQEALKPLGVRPLAFRPPVGITNPYLFRALIGLGMYCAGFNCRGPDYGNSRVSGLAKRILRKVRPGDVVLLHDRSPKAGTPVEAWLDEVDAILTGIEKQGLKPAPLSQVIRRPVMEPVEVEEAGNQARVFYDGLAESYDAEQDQASQSLVRRVERERVLNRLPRLLHGSESVLEIGAGTGRFTLPVARAAGRVVAADLSGRMLDILARKAKGAGVENITIRRGDIARMSLPEDLESFDLICSFSCLEYVADLQELFRRLHPLLKTGGILYFTIAHRSFFRFFAQLGNAMRQGMWLHARSRKEIRRMLEASGFTTVEIPTHALKSVVSSGVLMEVVALKCAGSEKGYQDRLASPEFSVIPNEGN